MGSAHIVEFEVIRQRRFPEKRGRTPFFLYRIAAHIASNSCVDRLRAFSIASTPAITGRQQAARNKGETKRTLPFVFSQRFLLHVLPKGFKRIRHYGLIGPAHKAARLAAACLALRAPVPDPVVVESVAAFMHRIDQHERLRCPHCGKGQFVPTAAIAPVPLPMLRLRGPP